jgi:bifunctional UDP-N-acetylglucosamine pyrophosphorylase / glucosamine-1-phosphate N-acetyltransferase
MDTSPGIVARPRLGSMPHERPLTAVILAAGLGTRMRSRIAKVLHPLCGRTMIGWALHAVAPLRPLRIAVVVGHQAEEVSKAVVHEAPQGSEVIAVEQHPQLGTGHALVTALASLAPLPDEDLLVIAADHPFLDAGTLATLLYAHRDSDAPWTLITAQVEEPHGYGRVLYDSDGFVKLIIEERDCGPEEAAVTEVSPVMYCIRRAEVEPLLGALGPADHGEVYLNSVIEMLEGVVAVRADPDVARQVNDRIQLAESEALLRRRINEELMRAGVTMVDPGSVYVDADVSVGVDSVLYPNVLLEGATVVGEGCTVGPDVRIIDSDVGDNSIIRIAHIVGSSIGSGVTVGPYASLRAGCQIEDGAHLGTYVELKNSLVGRGSKVPHLGYVGDAELGPGVNFSAGAITCNYDGREKFQTVIEEGAFVGSGTMLRAPVRIGKEAYTAAGSVVIHDVPPGALAKGAPARNEEGWVERTRGKNALGNSEDEP